MTSCDIHQATHVKHKGQWHRIASKWGIDAEGHLAKLSEGGFGCVTEDGQRIGMMEAEAYRREEMNTLHHALNKLAKWRMVFAGWQLGTRPKGDPESDAVRDHREATMMLRAEVNALIAILVTKQVITPQEWTAALEVEALALDRDYEKRFPGFKATEHGMDVDAKLAQNTIKNWRPWLSKQECK